MFWPNLSVVSDVSVPEPSFIYPIQTCVGGL